MKSNLFKLDSLISRFSTIKLNKSGNPWELNKYSNFWQF